ncbi:chemotaxis protein CheB [Desertivirga xinjiangensis]|uniref:chemotaxis protein CheB n=1 Tax=Desertivirga xinjiangensis TaxID=539206 RepID=UPI00210D111C|nr:chemotaxis protein CheB [Pedobacter xinjiangensis]
MEKDGLKKVEAILIGGSAGSLDVILRMLPDLRRDLSLSIIIILHRSTTVDNTLVDLLSSRTSLMVKEAEEKEKILPGIIYIAPPDYHLLVENDRSFSLDFSEKILYSRPAIDVTFQTAADVYKSFLVAILLSGANADGSEGLVAVQNAGGITIVQDPADAEINYMPHQALLKLTPAHIMKKADLAGFINRLPF